MTPQPYKSCRCCGRTFTAPDWFALSGAFTWDFDDTTLIGRNCTCGSTLVVETPAIRFAEVRRAA